jgi:hypothetical protein
MATTVERTVGALPRSSGETPRGRGATLVARRRWRPREWRASRRWCSSPVCSHLCRVGGLCTGACAAYPFDDPALIRDFVPVSFFWMVPAIGMLFALVVFQASLGTIRQGVSRLAPVLALVFTLIGTSVLIVDYAIQLAVVAPSLLHGDGPAVVALSLFNPHGAFVALEDVGYWTLGLAFLGIAATINGASRAERFAHVVFLVGGILAVGALPAFVVMLGADLGYAYEIFVITVVDLALVVGGACVALAFRRPMVGGLPAGPVTEVAAA